MFFSPWFLTAHRHLMISDVALMTNYANKTSYLNDREFVIRMLYRDSYWSPAYVYKLCLIFSTLPFTLYFCHKLRFSAFA